MLSFITYILVTVVANVGAVHLPMNYMFFYLSISELSSVPLLVYDQLSVFSNDSKPDGVDDLKTTTIDSSSVAISFKLSLRRPLR